VIVCSGLLHITNPECHTTYPERSRSWPQYVWL